MPDHPPNEAESDDQWLVDTLILEAESGPDMVFAAKLARELETRVYERPQAFVPYASVLVGLLQRPDTFFQSETQPERVRRL